MLKKIDEEEYKDIFSKASEPVTKGTRALSKALDIRKFEIELYWKRATYFWTFLAATFAGYFLILSKGTVKYESLFFISCLGFIFSYCWFLVNRGSKYWQNNWEKHVDLLEDREVGPLYKTVIQNRTSRFWSLTEEFPFSVSKVNQLLSLYVTGVWFFLLCINFFKTIHELLQSILEESFYSCLKNNIVQIEVFLFLIYTFAFLYYITKNTKSNHHIESIESNNELSISIRD